MQLKRTNFHWYASIETMQCAANNMVTFGAENLKRAKIIQELAQLKQAMKSRENGKISQECFNEFVHPFIFEKYTDLVKICLFFENYMKAQLILQGFLIHKINYKANGCSTISSEQQKRPITTKELHSILPFEFDENAEHIYNEGLTDQTLIINTLLNREKYQDIIGLPENVRTIINGLAKKRNELHFISVLEFELSDRILEDMDAINDFVDGLFQGYRMHSGSQT